jgi:hypothetical protein
MHTNIGEGFHCLHTLYLITLKGDNVYVITLKGDNTYINYIKGR